jgi:hypothetical protein
MPLQFIASSELPMFSTVQRLMASRDGPEYLPFRTAPDFNCLPRAGGCCAVLSLVLLAQPASAQAAVAGESLDSTIQWLANKLAEVAENNPPQLGEFADWRITGVDGCKLSMTETIYSNGNVRLSTVWNVPLSDIDVEFLLDQIRFAERYPKYVSGANIRLSANRVFRGTPEVATEAYITPDAVLTWELKLPLPTGDDTIEVEKALLYTAVTCGADSPRLD